MSWCQSWGCLEEEEGGFLEGEMVKFGMEYFLLQGRAGFSIWHANDTSYSMIDLQVFRYNWLVDV